MKSQRSWSEIGTRVFLLLSIVLCVALAHKVQALNQMISELRSPGRTVLGTPISGFSVTDVNGTKTTLTFAHSPSPPTILYVFRPTCGWCAKNLQNIKELARVSRENGRYKVVGVSIDSKDVKEYAEHAQMGFPVYTDIPETVVKQLGMGGTPQTLLIKDGVVVQNWPGAYSGDLRNKIEAQFNVKLPGLVNSSVPHAGLVTPSTPHPGT